MNDDKINVLILGTSGCGKSTLINAILEANEAETGNGEAVTKEIAIYQNDDLPFRMIDTVGYEYGLLRQFRIKRDISKFCKDGVQTKNIEKLIHMIWFCIDGTTKRIDQEVLGYIKSVTNDWKNVPVIIVFTKSYSSVEIDENIQMASTSALVVNGTATINIVFLIAFIIQNIRQNGKAMAINTNSKLMSFLRNLKYIYPTSFYYLFLNSIHAPNNP